MTPATDEGNAAVAETDTGIGQEGGDVPPNDSQAGIEVYGGADGVAEAASVRELQAIVESLLFVSQEPLSIQRLTAVIGDVSKAEIMQALQGLGEELAQKGRGIRLVEIAGGFRLVTKQEYASWIRRMDKTKSAAKLSRSALESLAIIAYKQPIVRAEIEEIRGVETSGVVRTLLERKMVRIVGRKEVPGRPIMYGTTKYFLEHFGLNDLSQLPPLREFKELGESEQAMLPMDDFESLAANSAPEATDTAEANLTLALPDTRSEEEVGAPGTEAEVPEAMAEITVMAAEMAETVIEVPETMPEVPEAMAEMTEMAEMMVEAAEVLPEVPETVMEVEPETAVADSVVEPAPEADAPTSDACTSLFPDDTTEPV